MRRLLSALAAPLLLFALAACGSGSSTDAPSDDSPAAEVPLGSSDGGDDAPSEGAEKEEARPDPELAGTSVETVWVDDSWTIEDLEEDLCSMGMSETIHSEQDDMFTCGPTAAGAQACALEEDEEVLCIVDALGKQAIRFDSPTASDPEAEVWPAGQRPVPLHAELPDGVTCSPIAHDHDQHYDDMFSWFRCEDGSELLTEEYIDSTFTRGETWKTRQSIDQGEPEVVDLAAVTFAGR